MGQGGIEKRDINLDNLEETNDLQSGKPTTRPISRGKTRAKCFAIICVAITAVGLLAGGGGAAFYFVQLAPNGVGLRVHPENSKHRIDSHMFVLKQGDTNPRPSQLEGEGDINGDYVARTTKFLETYSDTMMGKRIDDKTGEEEIYQPFDLAMLGPCNKYDNYGYVVQNPDERVKPCVFIELNPIWGWTPEPYNCEAEKEKGWDSGAPCRPEVEKHLKSQGPDAEKFVYLNCRGRYPADQEALEGGLEYFPPNRGFPISYFPFKGRGPEAGGNFHSPLVAVKISPKPGHEGQLIHIECNAYYRDVKHDTNGTVTFELQIKDCY